MKTSAQVFELVSTGNYDQKAINKYFNQQVKEAKKWGADDTQSIVNADKLISIYKHNFLIRVAI
jgi:hypothetical protein